MSSLSAHRAPPTPRSNPISREPFRSPGSSRLKKERAPRACSIQYFKARKRQIYHGILRQRGKDVVLDLPRTKGWPRWRVGERIWFQVLNQAVVITRKPQGARGSQRYSTRIRTSHASLAHTQAQCARS